VSATIYLTALFAFCTLALDVGRVQVAKTELHRAADTAASSALAGLGDGTSLRRARVSVAHCLSDGATATIAEGAIVDGRWDEPRWQQFSPGRMPFNAVEVTVRRHITNENLLTRHVASLVGADTSDLSATAFARITAGPGSGFNGLDGIFVRHN